MSNTSRKAAILPKRHGFAWSENDYLTLLYWARRSRKLEFLCQALERTRAGVLPKLNRFGFDVASDGTVEHKPDIFRVEAVFEKQIKELDKLPFHRVGNTLQCSTPPLQNADFVKSEEPTININVDWWKMQNFSELEHYQDRLRKHFVETHTASTTSEVADATCYAVLAAKSRGLTWSEIHEQNSQGLSRAELLYKFEAVSPATGLLGRRRRFLWPDLDKHFNVTAKAQTQDSVYSKAENIFSEIPNNGCLFEKHLQSRLNRHQPQKESSIMNNTPAFEATTTTYYTIRGRNSQGMTDLEVLKAIEDVEGEVTRLKSIKTSSSTIKAEIAKLESAAVQIAKYLDNRDALSAAATVRRTTVDVVEPKLDEPQV